MSIEDALSAGVSFQLHPDGSINQVPLKPKQRKHSLQECWDAVGGYFELIPMNVRPKSWKMLADEDGKPKKLAVNPHASALCQIPGTVVVGTVFITRHV